MAHQLSITADGRAEMFSGRGINPWHSLGTVVEGLLKSREAIEAAHLDWEAEKRQLWYPGAEPGTSFTVPRSYAVVRKDTEKLLGKVGDRYQIFQNADAFEFFDAIVGEGRAVYDTAGALFDGKRIWISAKLNPADFRKSSDKLEHYVLLTNTFDGSQVITMRSVAMRVVCFNTLTAALHENTSVFRIPHMGKMEQRVDAVRDSLGIMTEAIRELEEVLETIRGLKMSEGQATDVADQITESEREVKDLVHLFGHGIGCEGKNRADMLNAVTQYTTHHLRTRGSEQKKAESRMDSNISGRGRQMQKRALGLLVP